MKRSLFVFVVLAGGLCGQQLPVRWDELVATDWAKAIELSKGTCLLPIGILEKHGPHLPIGSDLIGAQARAREVAAESTSSFFPNTISDRSTRPNTAKAPWRFRRT